MTVNLKVRRVLSIVASVALLATQQACNYIVAIRKEGPYYVPPRPLSLAVVSIDVRSDEYCRVDGDQDAPSKRRVRNMLIDELQTQFASGGITLVDRTAEGQHPIDLSLPYDRAKLIAPATDLPEPLMLAAEVRRWPCSKSPTEADIVFSLWTRDGTQVETQRVTGTMGASMMNDAYSLRVTPGREAPFTNVWSLIGTDVPEWGAKWLRVSAVEAFARAYVPHTTGWANAMFAPEGGSKPGIKLAKQGRFVDAIRSWQDAARSTGRGEPLFNIGSLLAIDGDPRGALPYFDEARRRGYLDMEWVIESARNAAALPRPLPMPK